MTQSTHRLTGSKALDNGGRPSDVEPDQKSIWLDPGTISASDDPYGRFSIALFRIGKGTAASHMAVWYLAHPVDPLKIRADQDCGDLLGVPDWKLFMEHPSPFCQSAVVCPKSLHR